MKFLSILFVVCAGGMLAACSSRDVPKLVNARSSTAGPDEFSILVQKPLQIPPNFTTLPPPTLEGGQNLADLTPVKDVIVALGGNLKAIPHGISDPDLIAYTERFGVRADIADVLALEDVEWRRRHRGKLLERLFNVNVYEKAYAAQALDAYATYDLWKDRGVFIPAPPSN